MLSWYEEGAGGSVAYSDQASIIEGNKVYFNRVGLDGSGVGSTKDSLMFNICVD